MATTSNWPLKTDGVRFSVPKFVVSNMASHALAEDLYPLAFGFYPKATGHSMQRTSHEDNLLIYCTDGEGQLVLNQQALKIKAGDLISLPAGQAHSYQSSTAKPWTIYWCHFEGNKSTEFTDYFFQDRAQEANTCVLNIGLHPKLIADFEQLLESRQSGYRISTFIHTACHLKQMMSYIGLLTPTALPQSGNAINLDKIHSFMQANIHQHLDLETVAELANLSKYHFSKKYKLLTGQSPIQHFIHLKMEHACYLLDISDKPVGLISQMLSYEDAHYFSRLFKKVIGLSPKEYRLLKRG